MTYVPLVLGILLALAGCLSIVSGYDIITIERGWTEVIAGTTAATGGIISICLWFVLRQIYHLRQAIIKTQAPIKSTFDAPLAAPAPRIIAEEENKAPVFSPLTTAFIADEASTPKIFADADNQEKVLPEVDERQKTFDFTHEPPHEPAFEFAAPLAHETIEPEVTEPAMAETMADTTAVAIEPEAVTREIVAHDIMIEETAATVVHLAPAPMVVDESAIETPVEHAPAETPEPEAAETLAPLAAEEPASQVEVKEEEPQPSPSALSLDEMWRRVSEEIERPILPAKTPASEKSGTERNWLEPRKPARTIPEPAPIEDPAVVDEVLARDDALERALEAELWAHPAGPAKQAEVTPHEAHVEPVAEHAVEAEPAKMAPQPEPYTPPPPVEPPATPPAVIGRYESDGTTYTMFADGSIEAQTENGIYQFASMADLKTFIEARQAPADA